MPQPKDNQLYYRALNIRADGLEPSTLDRDAKTVEVIGATENPVDEFDWSRYETVPTVLRMDGIVMPEIGQIPLLDTHSRYSASIVIGSYREMRIEGDKLVGRSHFSEVEAAADPWINVRDGHITDFSIGYIDVKSTFLEDGAEAIIGGVSYTGPVRVVSQWKPRELSCCPIGADEFAKVRGEELPAGGQNNNHKRLEDNNMPGKKKEENNNPGTAPAPEPVRSDPPAPASVAVPLTVDETKIREETAKAERQRTMDIDAVCSHHDIPKTMRTEFLNGKKDINQIRSAILDHLAKSPANKVSHRAPIEMGEDARDKFRSAGIDSLFLRTGNEHIVKSLAKPAPGASDLRGYTLKELARECLRNAGKPCGGDMRDMLGRALTTSDLPNILSNVANKFVLTGFETAEETWNVWCDTGSANDFKQQTLARVGETDDLDEIKEDGEYKYGKITDKKENYQLATYGKLFWISRQALINDDLNQLTGIPMKHGEAAARKVGDVVYAVLTANSAMGDNIALFHASHANVGTGGALSETTIAELIKLMKLQKDIRGLRRLNIRGQFIIAPPSLEGSAEIFFTSGKFAGSSTDATRNNPYAGERFTRVYEARLEDSSAARYYMAGPKGKTVTVYSLGGSLAPFMEQRQGWTVDGTEWKVRIDAAAKAKDWVALAKNDGP